MHKQHKFRATTRKRCYISEDICIPYSVVRASFWPGNYLN